MKLVKKLTAVFVLVSLLCACSTLSVTDDPNRHFAGDPLEGINRKVYAFNTTVDKLVLRPVAKSYDSFVADPAKKSISHFFTNLGEPLNVLNNLLQGKFERALLSSYRFAVNSTVGVLGLFDVAAHYQLDPAKEDLGQTLAAWGVSPGPYIMLPFLGPANLRDSFGLATERVVFSPVYELSDSDSTRAGLIITDAIDLRASLLAADKVLESQLDPYAFLKRTYEQSRMNAIYDGNPPILSNDDYDF